MLATCWWSSRELSSNPTESLEEIRRHPSVLRKVDGVLPKVLLSARSLARAAPWVLGWAAHPEC